MDEKNSEELLESSLLERGTVQPDITVGPTSNAFHDQLLTHSVQSETPFERVTRRGEPLLAVNPDGTSVTTQYLRADGSIRHRVTDRSDGTADIETFQSNGALSMQLLNGPSANILRWEIPKVSGSARKKIQEAIDDRRLHPELSAKLKKFPVFRLFLFA